jgi:hypothetical protein
MIAASGGVSMASKLFAITALLLACACNSFESQSEASADAKASADAHFAEVFPQVHLENFTTSVRDAGDRWIVTYVPPEGSTGDRLSIEVSKANGSIVRGLRGPCYIDGRSGWRNPCEFGQFGTSERAFAFLDSNKNGRIESSEWNAFSDQQAESLDSSDDDMKRDYRLQLALLFEAVDADANGEVSKAEWDQSQLIRFDIAR